MTTIKDLAKELGVSYEAVRQQVKRYEERELSGHVYATGKTQYLDGFAVEFLRTKRNLSPVVMQQQDRDEDVERIKQENQNLLLKVAEQADRISALAEWKAENALLLADAKHQRELLQSAEARAEQAEGALDLAVSEKLDLQVKLTEAEERARTVEDIAEINAQEAERAKAEAEDLRAKLDRLANVGWIERRKLLKELKKKG